MSATSNCNLIVDLTEKSVTSDIVWAFRETVNLSITGTGVAGGTDLILGLIMPVNGVNTLMAQTLNLTGSGPITGSINLNTVPLDTFFTGCYPWKSATMILALWDNTWSCLLASSPIEIINTPFDPSMLPPQSVPPPPPLTYAPLLNGVTNGNSHGHRNGDGAPITKLGNLYVGSDGNLYGQDADNPALYHPITFHGGTVNPYMDIGGGMALP